MYVCTKTMVSAKAYNGSGVTNVHGLTVIEIAVDELTRTIRLEVAMLPESPIVTGSTGRHLLDRRELLQSPLTQLASKPTFLHSTPWALDKGGLAAVLPYDASA